MTVALLSFFCLAVFQAFTSASSPPLPPNLKDLLSKEKVCFHNDEIFQPGEKFANKDCTGWCTCYGQSGSLGCVSLCPPSPRPLCATGTLVDREFPSADRTGRCTCKRKVCSRRPDFLRLPPPPAPENVCFYDDEIYKPGEKFANKDCTGWCTCHGQSRVGCVSLCPLYPRPLCATGTLVDRDFPSADRTGRCTCKRKVCSRRPDFLRLPPPPAPVIPECRNRVPNKLFIDSTCSGSCKCSSTGIACVSLCPPIVVLCSPGEEKEYYNHPMDEEGRCTCRRERCTAKIGV